MRFRRVRTWLPAAAVAVWAGLLYGLLRLAAAAPGRSDGLCGPWGCAPSWTALAAWHGCWSLLGTLPAWWAAGRLPARAAARLSVVLVGGFAAGCAAAAGWEAVFWLPAVAAPLRAYYPQRVAWRIATLTDVSIPSLLVWAILLAAARRARAGRANRPARLE